MHLSSLLIDVGDNPDRPRPGRLWLRNLYHVHQRLCMAFPSASRKSEDAHFLQPFQPKDFGDQQVHVERQADSGFLFRIDFPVQPYQRWEEPRPGGRAVILVQSAVRPDWDYAFHNARHLLAAPPQVQSFDPCFSRGQSLRFRLAANPTRRLSRHSLEADGQPVKEASIGKRVPVPNDRLFDWLARQAETSGFSVEQDCTRVQPGYIYMNKKKDDKGHRLRSVRYDGVLQVTDPDLFLNKAVIHGIGSGKAFGCGLLSTAPCQDAINLNPCEAA